jgi:glycosyltransferase involved in cell wall biosynthesis
MTTLRVIVDQIVAPIPGGIGRYTEELTRELIRTAPLGCEVTGIVSSSPEQDYERITTLLPGLAGLFKSALARRELEFAWQHGLSRLPGSGMVHATGLFAPLARHDRLNNAGDQTVVTIHDVIPWTHPEALSPRRLAWYKAMTKRAHRFADAVVVPTHAVAAALSEIYDFGDRVRVIGGAVSSKLTTPVDPDVRAARLELPDRYILSVGTLEPHKGCPVPSSTESRCSSPGRRGGTASMWPGSPPRLVSKRAESAPSAISPTPTSPWPSAVQQCSCSRVSSRGSACR